MYLFKTSGKTFNSVIENQKHASKGKPKEWFENELLLVSKNKSDCKNGEKQIQFIMRMVEIRPVKLGEITKYWPGNDESRWNYLIICRDTKIINQPFNLNDFLGHESKSYGNVNPFKKLDPDHEKIIIEHLHTNGCSPFDRHRK